VGGVWTKLFGANTNLAVSADSGGAAYTGEDKCDNLSKVHLRRELA
jgi:hypothetical protein